MATTVELGAMRRAVALSALGLGTTSPNPPVGCVVLDTRGRVVGEGFHERKGEAHAEARALAAAGRRAQGGTAIVTLEPCNHHGRTPPCHRALLDAGIARAVVALIDPTSRGEGGVARLREAGMDVEVGVLAEEARIVLGPWLASLRTRIPYVVWAPDADAEPADAFDAVLLPDGSAAEAIAGSHGPDALDLTRVSSDGEPIAVLAALYEGGVRRLLLRGGPARAAPFLQAGLVDRAVAWLEPASTGTGPIPTGFELVDVARRRGRVRVVAVPGRRGLSPRQAT